jgi:hypothetical protein
MEIWSPCEIVMDPRIAALGTWVVLDTFHCCCFSFLMLIALASIAMSSGVIGIDIWSFFGDEYYRGAARRYFATYLLN